MRWLATGSKVRSLILAAALSGGSLTEASHAAAAQGISTAGILGTVRAVSGASVDGASVHVLNTATGFASNTRISDSRFFVHGLDVGGPYVVEVRHIGFVPQRSQPLFLRLGERVEVRLVLQPIAVSLDQVVVTRQAIGAQGSGGAALVISDSLLSRLPTLNRNFLDFAQLTPQVSGKVGFQRNGVSAAGANLRFNSYLINGAEEHFILTGVPPEKSIPIDAVKEYQVLVAPFDIRYDGFAGALVNTVTQAGTNELRASAFAYWRNDRLTRDGAGDAPYERLQSGFSLGGPILRNRIHFFIAPELQRLVSPAPGPFLGQPAVENPPVPVTEADVARLESILRTYGLSAGSGGAVRNENPLRNLFARVDASIPPWNSRFIGLVTYAGGEAATLSRSNLDTFNLSSYQQRSATEVRLTSLQLHTDFAGLRGAHNELLASIAADRVEQFPAVREPLLHVLVPGTAGKLVSLNAGAHEQSQGRLRRDRAIKVRDELTLMWTPRHVAVLGLAAERFRIRPNGVVGGYGTWTFSGLDALARGSASRYEMRQDFGSASAELRGGQYGAYIGDDWRVGERLAFTLGIRGDLLRITGRAPYNAVIDSIFRRRTDEMPRQKVHVSPRFGFTWDLPGAEWQRVRGGVGVFTGRPPLAWIHPALLNYGVGIGRLQCGNRPGDMGPPPAFQPDYRNPPTACAGGSGIQKPPVGDVDLLDRNLRMAQSLRTSLAYERRLPWDFGWTTELLVTRYLSDFVFVNLDLVGPQGVDGSGRVMYGTIATNGVARPALRADSFPEVIDLQNTSRNYAQQLSSRVERRFAPGFAGMASYTFSRVRDVQSPSRVNQPGIVMWGDARAVSGRHEDLVTGISLNDLPHRITAAFTYTAPWRRWSTAFSFYYVGESGTPFTYRASGARGLGDLNADGSNINDPIYVPRNAFDTSEIRFSANTDSVGADNSVAAQAERVRRQQTEFEAFVSRTPCLQRQRGRIIERNSCREPWSHTTIAAVRQTFAVAQNAVEAEADVFNVLNLLHAAWGQYRVADPRLLEHVGQSTDTPSAPPLFRFDPARPRWTTLRTESSFQLQIALRYRF